MRKPASAFLAILMAASTSLPAATPAAARHRNGDAAIAAGLAIAIIGGIALSRHHHRHRYYNDYDSGYYDDAPSYSYRRSYYGGRSQGIYGNYGGGNYNSHHHHHHHHSR